MENSSDIIIEALEVFEPGVMSREDEYQYHFSKIIEYIGNRNRATADIIKHVDIILKNELWVDHFDSVEDFIKTTLNLEKPSFDRLVKANKIYLYLVQDTEDPDEQATLSLMKEACYRELRRIATDGIKLLRTGNETQEDFLRRLEEKDIEDFQLINDLWKKIYPHIRFHKEQENKILPNGGCHITAMDITLAAKVLKETLEAVEKVSHGEDSYSVSVADLDGKNYSLGEVIEKSGKYAPEVIDAINRLGISQELTEKLKRQKQHLADRLLDTHTWDKYEGICSIDSKGNLIITNDRVRYDMTHELSDVIGMEISITVKRPNKKYL